MIDVRGLDVRYRTTEVLRDLSLHVAGGEIVLLTGPSGSGKSTLARCLNGLIPGVLPAQVSGVVKVAGLDASRHPVHRLAQEVGLILQNPETQLFNLRVEEEVAFGPRNLGLPAEEIGRRVRWALDAVGLTAFAERRIATLSGGEKQRLVIAAALAMRPRALVLDEPLTNLDPAGAAAVLDVLRTLRDQGTAILLIEHKTSWVAELADRVLVVADGQVVLRGTVEEVARKRALLDDLGVRPLFPPPEEQPHAPSMGGGEPVVALEEVCFAYDGHSVLDDLSLTLRRGEFAALVGPNGAGKTTVAHLMAGLRQPQAGRVRWPAAESERRFRLPLPWLRRNLRWGRDVGLLLQNPLEQLFCDTVQEEVAFGPANYGDLPQGLLEQVLEAADLQRLRRAHVAGLSAGEQQRLALAAVLALAPEVLILDEPTLGQDWGHLNQLLQMVQAFNRRGVTVLLISHDAEVVRRYAHHIYHLQEGRIQALDAEI